jgi:cell pole-organizing protein PopZ
MTQPAKSQEPSMEEILASIRRIIADDDASKSAPRAAEAPKPAARPVPPPPPRILPEPAPPAAHMSAEPVEPPASAAFDEPVEEEGSDILDLTESMATPAFEPPPPSPPPSQPQAVSPGLAPSALPQFRKIEAFSDVDFDEGELKQASARSEAPAAPRAEHETALLSRETSAAVDSAFNALAQTVLVQNARTLEDLVREMLRPMLKSWLDDNLPGMVERLVRAEIERVARGGR